MSDWTTCLIDASAIRSIFGDTMPSLSSVELHELSLHRDGPRAVLRFDLSDYPVRPPEKWNTQQFNTVQIQLMLIGLHKTRINGWIQPGSVDFRLEPHGTQIKLTCNSDVMQIELIAAAARAFSR